LRNHEARIYALKSLEIYKTIGDERGRAMLLINLALIDYSEGRFDDARRQALEALAINQELGTLEGTAYSLDSIARVDYSERRYEDALSRAIQSLRMFNNTDNRKGLGISLYLVGQIAVKLRLLSAAFDLVALAFLVSAEIGFTLELAGGADLITMAARENYSEQQLADIKQRVFEAYQKDKGKELVENALIRLQQVDLSNDPTRQDFSPAPRDS
jgi:tetratricopeptide (TPR) repeat protein